MLREPEMLTFWGSRGWRRAGKRFLEKVWIVNDWMASEALSIPEVDGRVILDK